MIVNIFAPPVPYTIKTHADFNIAVESAALFLHEKNYPVDLIVGDFDSSDLKEIKATFPHTPVQVHDAMKDETDTMLAVQAALKKNPSIIYLYTNAGVRLDHSLVNLRLLNVGPVVLINDWIKAYTLKPGTHIIQAEHPFVSVFAAPRVEGLSLEGFKYPLKDATLEYGDTIGISNEGQGTVRFTSGRLLVIESRD